jgi:hypothetical protein
MRTAVRVIILKRTEVMRIHMVTAVSLLCLQPCMTCLDYCQLMVTLWAKECQNLISFKTCKVCCPSLPSASHRPCSPHAITMENISLKVCFKCFSDIYIYIYTHKWCDAVVCDCFCYLLNVLLLLLRSKCHAWNFQWRLFSQVERINKSM